MPSKYDVAAFIWPSYHYEPRLEHFWPEKDGEWYTVRRGAPRFEGHDMPKRPLLGYQDEADPAVMKQHVELGAQYGINTWIMDWYWYEEQPCLERQLNEGLIPALRGSASKFYLMWANHDAKTAWDMHETHADMTTLWSGLVDRAAFEPMAERIIECYLGLDTYYRIDDKPVFCIYQLPNFIAGLGSMAATTDAIAWFRDRVQAAGLPGLHLQCIHMNGAPVDICDTQPDIEGLDVEAMIQRLDFDSVTYYQYVHAAGGKGEYLSWADKATSRWEEHGELYRMFFPHVSIGWDNTQRFPEDVDIVTGSCPENFKQYLRKAKAYLDARPDQPPLVTINSWNEWTEGSYLLPDETFGYGYLEAVRAVFEAG